MWVTAASLRAVETTGGLCAVKAGSSMVWCGGQHVPKTMSGTSGQWSRMVKVSINSEYYFLSVFYSECFKCFDTVGGAS